MQQRRGHKRFGRVLAALLAVVSLTAVAEPLEEMRVIELPLNKTRVIALDESPRRISVGNEEVADIMMMRANQLYLVARSMGSTNVVLWDRQDRVIGSFNVQVTYDLENLKRKLHELLPEEDVRVHASHGAVVLSGEVSSAPKMQMALDLARGLVGSTDGKDGGGTVLNMMQVGGAQQVLLEVKVAEISRTFIRELGVKFGLLNADGNLTFGAISGQGHVITQPFTGAGAAIPPGTGIVAPGELITNELLDPRVFNVENKALVGSFLDGTTLFNFVIDAAQDEGLAKVLAEPTLTTLTGEEATFLAGGEFPLPVPGDNGSVAIDYKEFGVGLRFLPVVLDSGTISLDVDISVSELSSSNSVVVSVPNSTSNFFVPSLTKRRARSTVELASGQTIGVAGLINENLRERVNKFPGLGDIPVLGALFRSQEYVKGQSELVIFITPRFAKPIDQKMVRLPTDSFVEPSSAEFYLLGRLQGSSSEPENPPDERKMPSTRGGIEGRYGHDL